MSTKSMPGPFNCYAAALPDEPVFTILGRDPAFPATVAYWRDQRVFLGKNETEDDIGRLAAVANEISKAIDWRYQNLDPMGDGVPTWKLPRQFETDEKPIRVEEPAMECSVSEVLVDVFRRLDDARSDAARHNAKVYAMKALEKVIQAIADNVPVIPTNWEGHEDDPMFPIPEKPVLMQDYLVHVDGKNYTQAELGQMIRDAAVGGVAKGERQLVRIEGNNLTIREIENRLNTADKVAVGLRQVAQDMQSPRILGMDDYIDRINGHAADLGAYIPGRPVKGNRALGMGYQHPDLIKSGEDDPYKAMAEFVRVGDKVETLKPGERIVVDSEPEDLAHAPEVPMHRFSQFNKGVNFAYSRGLEVNPSHLPTALDAMLVDGWECICAFGKTDSQHIGFLFKRVIPEAIPSLVHLNPKMTPEFEDALKEYMTSRSNGINLQQTFRAVVDTEPMREGLESVRDLVESYRKGHTPKPRIEVHIEGMTDDAALAIMEMIECRLRWIPMEYDPVRIVGLIAHQPEAAFDFDQTSGRIESRKTLIKGDCGDMEFGRQQEP